MELIELAELLLDEEKDEAELALLADEILLTLLTDDELADE